MSYVSGDGKPRRKIVLFLVGLIVFFSALYLSIDVSSTFHIPSLGFFKIGCIVGLVLELVALFKLRQYDYAYTFCFILALITGVSVLFGYPLYIIREFKFIGSPIIDFLYELCSFIDSITEMLIMVIFVRATNRLAEQSYKGMPKLTLALTIAYLICILVATLDFLSLILKFTITNDFLGTLLAKIVGTADIVRWVGIIIFLVYALHNIKD